MVLGLYVAAVIAFLFLPILVVIATSVTETQYIIFPPQGLSGQWYEELLRRPEVFDSLTLSLGVAFGTAALSTTLGLLSALAIVRYRFMGRDVINTLLMSPIILPAIIVGIALLQSFTRAGLDASVTTLIIGHVIITLPYTVRLIAASLAGFDMALERAAQSLGASNIYTFGRITLPLISRGVVAAALFSFILSFDNVTISIFLTSPSEITLPVRLMTWIETVITPTVASLSASVVIGIAIVVLITERLVGLRKVYSLD